LLSIYNKQNELMGLNHLHPRALIQLFAEVGARMCEINNCTSIHSDSFFESLTQNEII
jgi:hypothetical protein